MAICFVSSEVAALNIKSLYLLEFMELYTKKINFVINFGFSITVDFLPSRSFCVQPPSHPLMTGVIEILAMEWLASWGYLYTDAAVSDFDH